jgi:hypothetical protein
MDQVNGKKYGPVFYLNEVHLNAFLMGHVVSEQRHVPNCVT